MMWKKIESVQHIVNGCEKLAQKDCKRRHNNVAKKVDWDLCKKNTWEHVPQRAVENEKVEMLWDPNVQRDNVIEARQEDHTSFLFTRKSTRE